MLPQHARSHRQHAITLCKHRQYHPSAPTKRHVWLTACVSRHTIVAISVYGAAAAPRLEEALPTGALAASAQYCCVSTMVPIPMPAVWQSHQLAVLSANVSHHGPRRETSRVVRRCFTLAPTNHHYQPIPHHRRQKVLSSPARATTSPPKDRLARPQAHQWTCSRST